ncbi:hypothetical protein Tco_0975325 [Tanacetum coccineum]|uniref:Reverse transcriptase domain-containing protein n=1 Tax=Tanacetum coccineum TaxID=301880 RepID=A0ABQ5EE45_9ASTR
MGPPGFPPPNVQNNQNYNRYNQNQAPNNQSRGQNFNQGNNNYQAPNFQAPNYQAQVGPSNELTNCMKSNEATLRAMQIQMTNMKTELRNEFKYSLDTRTNKIENQNNQMMNMLTNITMQKQSPSGSGSLPSNTIANLERETEVTKGTRSQIANIFRTYDTSQPSVVQVLIPKARSCSKALKPKRRYLSLSRLNDQKLREKANNQMLKFLQISKITLRYQLCGCSSSYAKKQISLLEHTKTVWTSNSKNRSVAYPEGVAEDVYVKVGKFYFSPDFVVVDYDVDPWVPLILGRPFWHVKEFNRFNVIDVACEEYAQEVLGFSDSSTNGNPTPSDPIIASSSHSFTPFEGGDFILEEIKACLSSDSIPPGIDDVDFDPEGDIRLLEKYLTIDPIISSPSKELNFEEIKMIKSSIDDPPELELKDFRLS